MISGNTTIEITLIIAIIGMIFTAINFFRSIKKDNRNETKSEATDMAVVISKLESIGKEVGNISRDVNELRSGQQAQNDRLIRAELQIESISKDIEKIKTTLYN